MGWAPAGLSFGPSFTPLYFFSSLFLVSPSPKLLPPKKVMLISLSDAPEGKNKWQKEWRKGTWVSGEVVELWGSSALSSPTAALDCFTKYLYPMMLQRAQPRQRDVLWSLYTRKYWRNSPACVKDRLLKGLPRALSLLTVTFHKSHFSISCSLWLRSSAL